MIRRVPLVLVAAAVVLVAACGDDPPLDTDGLEEQIDVGIEDAYGVETTSVVCPDDVEVEEGATFTCVADIDGQDFKVQVTQGESGEAPTYTNTQALITPEDAKVGAELRATDTLGFGVTADCGNRVIIGRPGTTFDCTLTEQSGATVNATFRIVDVRGTFEFAR